MRLPRDVETRRAFVLLRVVAAVVAVGLILFSWGRFEIHAQSPTVIFFSGWEDVTAGATDCSGGLSDRLMDALKWIDYGPGNGSVCSATPDLAQVTNVACSSGSNCLQLNFIDGAGDNGPDFRLDSNFGSVTPGTIYVYYRIKWSADWYFPNADNKTFIDYTDVAAQDTYLNVKQGSDGQHAIIYIAPHGTDHCEGQTQMVVGQWHTIEMRKIFGTGTSGSITVWVNGTQQTWSNCQNGINPAAMNTGSRWDGFKIDTTINCYDAGAPNICPNPNNWEFNVDTGEMWYDDVTVCTGARCTAPGGGGADTTAPVVAITSPTSSTTLSVAGATTSLGGTCSDDVAVSTVTWSNSAGGSGTATGTTSWSVSSIALSLGVNTLTVTCTDSSSNTHQDALAVTYTPQLYRRLRRR